MSRSRSINSLDTFDEDTDDEKEHTEEIESLRTEAEKIAAAVRNLKSYQPITVKKVGRPKKYQSPTNNQTPSPESIQTILLSIVEFQKTLLDKLSIIDNRNHQLCKQLSNFQKTTIVDNLQNNICTAK